MTCDDSRNKSLDHLSRFKTEETRVLLRIHSTYATWCYPGPPDLPFPSGNGESSRYPEVLTGSADGGVESVYMCENYKHGYSFL
jgi:hypothetical protein